MMPVTLPNVGTFACVCPAALVTLCKTNSKRNTTGKQFLQRCAPIPIECRSSSATLNTRVAGSFVRRWMTRKYVLLLQLLLLLAFVD